ncbi:hypothetical protein NU08_1346 [Flavobacterium anhuiense]|uniref:Uncharacterized protein n=1 Tax=Flavobacterium anhuiense TaxID=459526 RepID=A0A444W1C3_9FLAO|nr:hypothetical protein NU08_1346 [Flavobacterium anhuiense]
MLGVFLFCEKAFNENVNKIKTIYFHASNLFYQADIIADF